MRMKKFFGRVTALVCIAVLGYSTIVYAVSGNDIGSISGNGVSDNGMDVQDDTISQNTAIPPEHEEKVIKIPADVLVALDPGHGGEDEGCARADVLEKDVNMEIARMVQTKLQEMGYQVMLTREDDKTYSCEERVQRANAAGADLYVSIHQNAHETTEPNGVEVWYSDESYGEESKRLAELFQKYIVDETEAADRGVTESDSLYVIRESGMPSCLLETGFLSNAMERRKLTDPEYQEQIATGIAEAINLYFFPKTMYLTFDDGPSAENTALILDELKKRNIKATFFVIGENVERYPEIAKRIVAEGHTIGIHCYDHEYEDIYASADSYIEDFEKAHRIVYETTGVDTKLFRFPGGSVNAYNADVRDEIISRMTEKGFSYYDWNASLEDAVSDPDIRVLIDNATSSTLGRKKVVLLAHDIVDETALCIGDVIDAFPEYEMRPIQEDVEPIQFKRAEV